MSRVYFIHKYDLWPVYNCERRREITTRKLRDLGHNISECCIVSRATERRSDFTMSMLLDIYLKRQFLEMPVSYALVVCTTHDVSQTLVEPNFLREERSEQHALPELIACDNRISTMGDRAS